MHWKYTAFATFASESCSKQPLLPTVGQGNQRKLNFTCELLLQIPLRGPDALSELRIKSLCNSFYEQRLCIWGFLEARMILMKISLIRSPFVA